MSDHEKFEAFKMSVVKENEEKYGKEIRGTYGDEAVDSSNAKLMNLTKDEYEKWEKLGAGIQKKLTRAVQEEKSPAGEEGQEIVRLHRKWLAYSMKELNDEIHAGIVQMYVEDERFTAYYDKEVKGCAEFLRDAVVK